MIDIVNFKEYLALKKLVKAIEEIGDLDETSDEYSDNNNFYLYVTDASNCVVT